MTMRQTHRAGREGLRRLQRRRARDRRSGHRRRRQTAVLFVLVLGASNLTYVEPVLRQDLPTWIGCHVRAFAYFGGVPAALVPDNTKTGVTRPDYYDPELNPTYAELAQHYGTAIIPARPYKPRDKAKVEQGVLLAERWILAVLRDRVFTSLAELHEAIVPLLRAAERSPAAAARAVAPRSSSRRSSAPRCGRCPDRLRVRRLGAAEGEHRLPRRLRGPLLQRPVPAAR